MGKVTQLSYRHGAFVLFRMDVRCKIICICFMSIIVIKANFIPLLSIIAVLLWLLYCCKLHILTLIKELKYFFILIFFVFLVRCLVTSGTYISIPIYPSMKNLSFMDTDIAEVISYININFLPYLHITKEGVLDGAKVSLRFFIIMVMGILFACSTTSFSIKNAVIWFLKPIPFIPQKRVGVMVSLFVRFFPLILEKISDISDAQRARCAHLQKNPIKKIKYLTVPLLIKIFNSADSLAIAMASRCYNDNEIKEQGFSKSGYEIYFYLGTTALAAVVIFL